jgi:hypothetical protein
MSLPGQPFNRRRFLTAAALAAGAAAVPAELLAGAGPASAAVPPGVTLPTRGIHDISAATAWTDGFVSGNGEYGAVFYGSPTLEKVIFNHHRFVLPNGSRGLLPPVNSGQLASARSQALAGNYSGAAATMDNGWALRWTQTFHPAFELQINTPAMTTANNYVRITDFETGEASSAWSDSSGTWLRRGFISRADQVVVHELRPASGQTVSATLSLNTALDGAPSSVGYSTTASVSTGDGYLDVRGTYPAGGAYGFEGVTRVVVTGSGASVTVSGSSLVVSNAATVLLLTKLDRYETSTGWNSHPLQTALAALTADYATLLGRHAPLHQARYDRSSIDLNVSAADRQLSTSELIARQNGATSAIDIALLERMYDSGRYLFVSSCGVLPPRLTGLWTGTWNGSWADDMTTDANVNLQVAGGNILDLSDAMQGYFHLFLGQLSDWQTNATNIYGCRGYLAPTRTDGEYGHMLHFDSGGFPGEAWTGGADWMLWPMLEYYQVTGDSAFLKNSLGPALMTLALFYEDFLTTTDSSGKVVFVPSFSPENQPSNTGQSFAINATCDIAAARHTLQAAVAAAGTLGVEQGAGQGVQRWTALLAKLPAYRVNSDGALAEWAWPSLNDNYDHRHISHLYGAWPLHEINPEENPSLISPANRALDLRGDESLAAHGSLHRALARPAQERRGRLPEPAEDPRQQHGLPRHGDGPLSPPGRLQLRRRQHHPGGALRSPRIHPARRPGATARAAVPDPDREHQRRARTQPGPRPDAELEHDGRDRDGHPDLGPHPGHHADLPARHRHGLGLGTGRGVTAGRPRTRGVVDRGFQHPDHDRAVAGLQAREPQERNGPGRQRRRHVGRHDRDPVAVVGLGQPAVDPAAERRRLAPGDQPQQHAGTRQPRRLGPGCGPGPVDRHRKRQPGVEPGPGRHLGVLPARQRPHRMVRRRRRRVHDEGGEHHPVAGGRRGQPGVATRRAVTAERSRARAVSSG